MGDLGDGNLHSTKNNGLTYSSDYVPPPTLEDPRETLSDISEAPETTPNDSNIPLFLPSNSLITIANIHANSPTTTPVIRSIPTKRNCEHLSDETSESDHLLKKIQLGNQMKNNTFPDTFNTIKHITETWT